MKLGCRSLPLGSKLKRPAARKVHRKKFRRSVSLTSRHGEFRADSPGTVSRARARRVVRCTARVKSRIHRVLIVVKRAERRGPRRELSFCPLLRGRAKARGRPAHILFYFLFSAHERTRISRRSRALPGTEGGGGLHPCAPATTERLAHWHDSHPHSWSCHGWPILY